MFDPENPPTTYKEFKKVVVKTVEQVALASDESHDTALFLVDRDNIGAIVYADDIYEESDRELTADQILYQAMPGTVRSFESKFFGLVMNATATTADEGKYDIVIVITSEAGEMHVQQARLDRSGDYVELEPWEKKSPLEFHEVTLPFRRAITLQG